MRFRSWLEGYDSSVRRKLQGAVQEYLGTSFLVGRFNVKPDHADSTTLFGASDGIRQDNGDILVKTVGSGLHELLHQAGFMPVGIGEFLNEGILQVVAEDIAKGSKLPINRSYPENTAYVRKYLLPAVGVPLREFARAYAKSRNKGKTVVDAVWRKNAGRFADTGDWGQNPYESMLKTLPFMAGSWNAHLNYLVDD